MAATFDGLRSNIFSLLCACNEFTEWDEEMSAKCQVRGAFALLGRRCQWVDSAHKYGSQRSTMASVRYDAPCYLAAPVQTRCFTSFAFCHTRHRQLAARQRVTDAAIRTVAVGYADTHLGPCELTESSGHHLQRALLGHCTRGRRRRSSRHWAQLQKLCAWGGVTMNEPDGGRQRVSDGTESTHPLTGFSRAKVSRFHPRLVPPYRS